MLQRALFCLLGVLPVGAGGVEMLYVASGDVGDKLIHFRSGAQRSGPLDHRILLVVGHGFKMVQGPPILEQPHAQPRRQIAVVQ